MRPALPALALVAVACALSAASGPASAGERGLEVTIVNYSGRPARDVYVMLHNGSSADGKLQNGVPVRLSALAGRRFRLSSIAAGRIFFSYGAPVSAAEPPRSPIRYDKVELTYPGVANLTSVDFFGIPFRLQAFDPQGRSLGKLRFYGHTDAIVDALLQIDGARRALVKTRDGRFARVLSPQLALHSYPSFAADVASLAGQQVTLRGAFYGTPYQTFVYSGTFDGNGSIRLKGTIDAPNGGTPSPARVVTVSGSTLPRAIYTVDGPYRVGGVVSHVSDNDVYSVIYRDLISGFAAGYLGGRYGNDSGRWARKRPFAAARASAAPYATYNEYAAAIYGLSDAYGFSFSDVLPKKVQLPLDRAARLKITIMRDS